MERLSEKMKILLIKEQGRVKKGPTVD